jgi:hypothetical protein
LEFRAHLRAPEEIKKGLIRLCGESARAAHYFATYGFPIAVVPSGPNQSSWSVMMNAGQRLRHPLYVKRIEKIEKQLRRIYALAE